MGWQHCVVSYHLYQKNGWPLGLGNKKEIKKKKNKFWICVNSHVPKTNHAVLLCVFLLKPPWSQWDEGPSAGAVFALLNSIAVPQRSYRSGCLWTYHVLTLKPVFCPQLWTLQNVCETAKNQKIHGLRFPTVWRKTNRTSIFGIICSTCTDHRWSTASRHAHHSHHLLRISAPWVMETKDNCKQTETTKITQKNVDLLWSYHHYNSCVVENEEMMDCWLQKLVSQDFGCWNKKWHVPASNSIWAAMTAETRKRVCWGVLTVLQLEFSLLGHLVCWSISKR